MVMVVLSALATYSPELRRGLDAKLLSPTHDQ